MQRSGTYRLGGCTIRDGEAAVVTSRYGVRSVVEGPKYIHPGWGATVDLLERRQCDSRHYLRIAFMDGRVEHKRGPTHVILDPLVHKSVDVLPAVKLEGNEAIVVYCEQKEGKIEGMAVSRRIVRGPAVFIPSENEWLAEFSWHGTQLVDGKGSITGHHNDVKKPHAVKFNRIRMTSDHMYLTTREVRSKDDATLDLHCMIFFQCFDLERMLENTNDVISDMINATSADVMAYASKRSYEDVLLDSGLLSETSSYPILESRLKSIGYKLEKVVYRGYNSSQMLQNMQESSISSRTKLRLEADTRRHEAANQMMELQARKERQELEQAQLHARETHEAKIRVIKSRAAQEELDQCHQQKLRHLEEEHRVQEEHSNKVNQQKLDFLKGLSNLGVNLTQYLVAIEAQKPDYHMVVASAENMPQLHLQVPPNKQPFVALNFARPPQSCAAWSSYAFLPLVGTDDSPPLLESGSLAVFSLLPAARFAALSSKPSPFQAKILQGCLKRNRKEEKGIRG